ncbi:MAG TPA: hypothetical protein VKS79_17470 [Gemmataceae bacterium]|nr:hypothetical protein [Gemmataceae bacterium]
MLTTFGKIFVFLNVIVALGLLAATAVVIKERVQWNSIPEKQLKGEVDKYRDQIKDLAEARDRAEAKWNTANTALFNNEKLRPANQDFYEEQMLIAKTGKDKKGQPVNPPVVVFAQPLNFKRQGQPPLQVRGQPARELKYYTETIIARQREIFKQQEAVAAAQQEYEALSRRLDQEKLDDRGIYMMQRSERDAKERAIAEQDFIKPLLANRYSELVLALKREQILSQRKAELEKVTAGGQ